MKFLAFIPAILSAMTVLVTADEAIHSSTHHLMEHTNAARIKGITHVRKAHSDEIHEVIIAVKHRNLDWLEKKLDEVSYPDSAYYGQHMTKDEITAMVASPESTKTVREYLKGLGFAVVRETRHGEYLFVKGKIHQFEQLFATEFHEYSMINSVSGQREAVIRAEHYSLPLELVEHVSTAFHTVQFPPPIMSRGKPKALGFSLSKGSLRSGGASPDSNSPAGYVTPQLLNDYYCIPSNTGNAQVTQAVYESLNQTMSPADLTDFQNYFGLPLQAIAGDYNGHVDSLTCIDDPNDCDEANLDVQYMMGISQAVPTYYYYWNSSTDPFISWITAVADMSNPQDVYSISYSSYEAGLSASELNEWNTQAQILGVAGTTILSASGDDGVAGFLARDYPDGYDFCGYNPQFPASSPYTLAVGGTQGPQADETEIVCSSSTGGSITSGGGFSDYYKTPSYQQSVVNTYLDNLNSNTKPVSGYNTTGRGYPDVSLLAYKYLVFIGGNAYAVSGTSASTPVMGAFISLVNSYRKANGQSTMGWANPAIYQNAANYAHDITSGENNCAAQNDPQTVCCSEGFIAVEGWDPTTGLGSVNFLDFAKTFATNYPYSSSSQCPTSAGLRSYSSFSMGAVLAVMISVVAGFYF